MRDWRFLVLLALAAGLLVLSCTQSEDPEDDDRGNTETGEDLDPAEVVEVGVRPTLIQIDASTELGMKAHAATRDGGWYDTIGGTWAVSDESIATIDQKGALVPQQEGEVQVTYTWEGFESEPATVQIVPPGTMEVTLVDWVTGEPVVGATVGVSTGAIFLAQGETDEQGHVTLQGPFSGKVHVTFFGDDDHRRQTLADVAPRQVAFPVVPMPGRWGTGKMHGVVSFDEDDQEPGTIGVALVVPALAESPISISAGELLGENRKLQGYNLAWEIPENVQIQGIADTFIGNVDPGERVVFAAGGVYDLGVALELAFNIQDIGIGAIFPTITGNIEQLRFGASQPIEFPWSRLTKDIELECTTELPLENWVDVAPPPAGHYWPEPILVLGWRPYADHGLVAVGFGTGNHPYLPEGDPPGDDDTGDDDDATGAQVVAAELEERVWVPVREVARDGVFEDVGTRYYAFIQENGIEGGNRGTAVISPPTTQVRTKLPDFLELIEFLEPEPGSWVYELQPPVGTDMMQLLANPECNPDYWLVTGPTMTSFRFPQGLPMLYEEPCNSSDGPGMVFAPEAWSLERASYQSLINLHDEPMRERWTYVNRRTYAAQWVPDVEFP